MAASDQRTALNDAAERIQGVRAACVSAQTNLAQQQTLLLKMQTEYAPYVTAAAGGPFAGEWAALVPEFGVVKTVVDAAVAAAPVVALKTLKPGA